VIQSLPEKKMSTSQEDLYAKLEALPEHETGEIISGRFYTNPKPAGVLSRLMPMRSISLFYGEKREPSNRPRFM
jgi:hypothetical protein